MGGRTVFMFSGQGSQYYQMGRQLYDENRVFRAEMDRLDAAARALGAGGIVEKIHAGAKAQPFDRILETHPAIYMVEYAAARCLIAAGIEPDLTLGASLGSFAAAAVAGHLDPEDGLAAVIGQARAIAATCPPGGMLAVMAEPALFQQGFMCQRSELAGINFAGHFALAGAPAALAAIETDLLARGVTAQRLAVGYAFHSAAIDPAEQAFSRVMAELQLHLRAGRLPLACCEQAGILDTLPDGFFWRAVRRPMRFRDTIAHLERQGPWRYIDAGPSGTLATFVKYGLPPQTRSSAHALLTPYGRDAANLAALSALAAPALRGAPEAPVMETRWQTGITT